jgi:hypothetical protein
MIDTCIIEGGNIWPRRYTIAELETIANAARIEKCGLIAKEKLQRSVEAYQWASAADSGGPFFRSSKQRCIQFKRILQLRARNASAEQIDEELETVDAVTSQLLPIPAGDPKTYKRAAGRALKMLSRRGPNPRRARLQFVTELICIFEYATRRRAGRSVHFCGQERGQFRAFVIAALKPFNVAKGCEADIRLALTRHKTRLRTVKKGQSVRGVSR